MARHSLLRTDQSHNPQLKTEKWKWMMMMMMMMMMTTMGQFFQPDGSDFRTGV
jgi:hypothetical protein